MAIETQGTLRMRGEADGSSLPVSVTVDDDRIRLLSGDQVVGDWAIRDIGITALHDSFAIRAEGEELILRVSEDARLAEELGLAAASPRMARKVAALGNPPEPESEPSVDAVAEPKSNILAIAFALGGGLVLLGGSFLRLGQETFPSAEGVPFLGGVEPWLLFLVMGGLMVAIAYLMATARRGAQTLALVVVAAVVLLLGLLISRADGDTRHLTAYVFISGGLVVGVAVLFGRPTRESE